MAATSTTQLLTPFSTDAQVNEQLNTSVPTYNYEMPYKSYINFSFDSGDYRGDKGLSVTPLNDTQKQAVRNVLNYVHNITGINFNEKQPGQAGNVDMYFGYANLNQNSMARNYYPVNSTKDAFGNLTSVDRSDSIVLNSYYAAMQDTSPGGWGYMGILQGVGMALGLKGSVPADLNNPSLSVFADSQNPASTFGTSDIKSLNWIYGGDGLRGKHGLTVDASSNPVAGGFSPDFRQGALLASS